MAYPFNTQDSWPRLDEPKSRAICGRATLTMNRSRLANTTPAHTMISTCRGAAAFPPATGVGVALIKVDSVTELTLTDCVLSRNPLVWVRGTEELRRYALLGGPVPRGRGRMVVDADRPGCLLGGEPLRPVPGAAGDLPQRVEPAPLRPGGRRGARQGPLQRTPAPLRLPAHRHGPRP